MAEIWKNSLLKWIKYFTTNVIELLCCQCLKLDFLEHRFWKLAFRPIKRVKKAMKSHKEACERH